MPLSRLADRLVREEKRQFVDEEKRRHELWINFAALFFSNRGESTAPETKEEFDERRKVEEGKKKPKPLTQEEWQQQALARKSWASTREVYFTAALSEYHFEEAFHFGGHYFDAPQEPEQEPASAEDIRAQEQAAQERFIANLEAEISEHKPG